ncbi:MAG: oligopeptide:H+ symporter [Parachlamydiaceae bacterium]
MSQPKGFYLLNFASMWECFSYYGLRALLVLFMVKELKLQDNEAYATYALYITLTELGGVLGGVLADKLLSLKGAIVIGGWAIFSGHLLLGFSQGELPLFFLSLGLIIAGTNLFRVNIPAAIGTLYEEGDEAIEKGFTIFYVTMNIGGLLAMIVCGFLGESYGWHIGFGAAACGMLLGNIVFIIRGKVMESLSLKTLCYGLGYIAIAAPAAALSLCFAQLLAPFATLLVGSVFLLMCRKVLGDKALKRLAGLTLFLILFYGCEELLGSSLVLFTERHVSRMTLFGEIPASMLMMFNPLTILLTGTIISRICIGTLSKIRISLLFLGVAFTLLYCVAGYESISFSYAIAGIAAIAIGELFIGPTIYAESAKISPKNEKGFTMAIVTLGFTSANLLSGSFSQLMTTEQGSTQKSFQDGFGIIALLVFIALGLSYVFVKGLKSNKLLESCEV